MAEEKPLISVIVPVYNILEYLPRCVESLCRQTYPNLEILLVDDGSTDGTGQLCDKLGEKDTRIRVFHKENGGSSSARNLGIAKARGKYLGFVDSDDYVDSRMYELLEAAIEKYQVKAAQVGRDEIDQEGHRLPDICESPEKPECIPAEDFLRELLMHRGDCSFCTKLIAREAFEKELFPEGILNEDFHLLLRILEDVSPIVSLPNQCYHVFYRIGSNSRKEGANNFSRVFEDIVRNADMAEELVEKEYPRLKKEVFRFGVFQRLDYLLHVPVAQMGKNNILYTEVVSWMRKNWLRAMTNPLLTGKNKLYHTLFAIAPRTIRKIHATLRHIR